jgi:uncharacterized protein (TIGR04255 family)
MLESLSKSGIDITQNHPHLSKAPIVEAVIELKSLATLSWKEEEVLKYLASVLPEYNAAEKGVKSTIEIPENGAGEEESGSTTHRTEWVGYRFKHKTEPYLAQFQRDGFLLSRLKPYENWDRFLGEALRLWDLYVTMSKPDEIQRMGVRFVNLLEVPFASILSDFLNHVPVSPVGLNIPFLDFLYSDTLKVPDSPYSVRIIRTIKRDLESEASFGLIIDIDVFTDSPIQVDHKSLEARLSEMRWLKNATFFGTTNPKCIEELR